MSEWQPIETAPKDGTHILATNRFNELLRAAWEEDPDYYTGWIDVDADCDITSDLTHWMSVPPLAWPKDAP